MGGPEAPDGHELRSFGRRHGRKFSASQERLLAEDLPRVAIDLNTAAPGQASGLFGAPVREVWLEIGFGGGEHLIWQAESHPDVGLIGCEPYLDGVVKVLAAVQSRKLDRIRLHADDARPLLRWLPESSISRAFVLFPDPWPKARHHKRRLISPAMVDALARVIQPGGQFRIATDIGDYARTALLAMVGSPDFQWLANSPADWRVRPADWPQTRYEQKAAAAGRRCYYFRFERI
ncbi:tRNA (guanine(46)-N(7))-methyltransferase TrmB [Leptospira interrogans]